MTGTDGTVCVSGASMRGIYYNLNMQEEETEGISKPTVRRTANLSSLAASKTSSSQGTFFEVSSVNSALRLFPQHSHRTIVDKLLEGKDVFYTVRRALRTKREDFDRLKSSLSAMWNPGEGVEQKYESNHWERDYIQHDDMHTPGKLMLFRYLGNKEVRLRVKVLRHLGPVLFGESVKPHMYQIKDDEKIGNILSRFKDPQYHSITPSMFHLIVDLPFVANELKRLQLEQPETNVCLAFRLKGNSVSRIIASTSWKGTFQHCSYDQTLFISLAPFSEDQEEVSVQTSSEKTTSQSSISFLQSFKSELEDTDDLIMSTREQTISTFIESFRETDGLKFFIEEVIKQTSQLSESSKSILIKALVPHFDNFCCQELALILLLKTTGRSFFELKKAFDQLCINSSLGLSSSNIMCPNFYSLVFSNFTPFIPRDLLASWKIEPHFMSSANKISVLDLLLHHISQQGLFLSFSFSLVDRETINLTRC